MFTKSTYALSGGLSDAIPTVLALAAASVLMVSSAGAAGLEPAQSKDYQQQDLAGTPESYDRFGWAIAAGDFDCDGKTDYAVGMPRENVATGGKNYGDAGLVQIIYGNDSGQITLWHQGVDGVLGDPEAGDQFGYALAAGDFDAENCDDLAIGIPLENVGDVVDAGAVQILYGRSTVGLSASGDQLWYQGGNGMAGTAEARDQFGFSLAAGHFGTPGTGDPGFYRRTMDLAIGVPREDVDNNTVRDAGAVHIIYGSSSGLRATGNRIFRQGADGLRGKAEHYDLFGWSLVAANFDNHTRDRYDDLAVGIPYEDLDGGKIEDAGAVQILYGSAHGLNGDRSGLQIFSQEHDEIQGAAETGDWFGFALAAADFDGNRHADLAVGIPLEDLALNGEPNKVRDGGAVQIFYGTSGGLKTGRNHILSQSGGVQGSIEKDDEFGRALAAGNFDGNKYHDLAVGVPLEDHDGDAVKNSGAVNVFYGRRGGIKIQGNQIISQAHTGVAVPEANDHFGFALCADQQNGNAVDSLAVGAPRETLGSGDNAVTEAGVVIVIPGSS